MLNVLPTPTEVGIFVGLVCPLSVFILIFPWQWVSSHMGGVGLTRARSHVRVKSLQVGG